MNNISNGSFIAISDFHSYHFPVEKIKDYYLNEYDCIYILGDATDRGPLGKGQGGIELLKEIKSLCDQFPDRVFYIPGNHDSFVYGTCVGDAQSSDLLWLNGGIQTFFDLQEMIKNDPETFADLITWLGKQPMQRKHVFEGKKYCLAHAFFNEKLYVIDDGFGLYDMFSEQLLPEIHDMAMNTIWFRKDQDFYDRSSLPTSDFTMVIGHTPSPSRKNKNLDLVNENGEIIKVKCVDGGIAYGGEMLKYDGSGEPYPTFEGQHSALVK